MREANTPLAERLILALDFPDQQQALQCLDEIGDGVRFVKVGMELFYAAGFAVIEAVKQRGLKVFLDLKVHDIPNTAKGAMRSLARHGVDLVTVHVAGGQAMLEAACEGLAAGTPSGQQRPLIVGITMLTSTSKQVMNEQLAIPGEVEEVVASYARLAFTAGLDGVVSSPWEVPLIKQATGQGFLTVTPGIRPQGAAVGDQQRIATPARAFALGSDYLVIGRPVTAAPDPQAAWQALLAEVNQWQESVEAEEEKR